MILESSLDPSPQAGELFRITPAVNFFADMETDNVFGPCDGYRIDIKPMPGGNEITMRIFNDSIYIAVPVVGIHWDYIKKTARNYVFSYE